MALSAPPMVHSASYDGRRRKNTYLAVSAVILAVAVYIDFVTSSSTDDGKLGPKGSSRQQFLPIFTTPTFIILILIGIFTVGTREKWDSENDSMGGVSSAYSVFNEGGRTMMGGMTAEELDGQLRGGPVGGYGYDHNDMAGKPGANGARKRVVQQRQHESTNLPNNNNKRQEQLRRERAEAAMKRMKGT